MAVVLKILIVSVTVDSHEHGFFDANFGVHNGGDRGDAVGGAAGVTENRNGVGVFLENSVVHPEDNCRDSAAFDGGGDDDTFDSSLQVLACKFLRGK